jgi:two-component system, OmpR family, response regulator RegX3
VGDVRVLVVEDDGAIAGPLVVGLRQAGFDPVHVTTGADALAADPGGLVLLDLGLPDMDGLDVCRTLRGRSAVPIIITTARGEEVDTVVGLEVGADDYLVKPFGMREVVARMRAVLRRTGARGEDAGRGAAASRAADDDGRAVVGDLVVDARSRRVHVGGTEVVLTPKEFDVLALLASDPGAVLRREEIIDRVWDHAWFGPTRTIDVHVAALRKKLGDPRWITTVRGVGFRLDPPADAPA